MRRYIVRLLFSFACLAATLPSDSIADQGCVSDSEECSDGDRNWLDYCIRPAECRNPMAGDVKYDEDVSWDTWELDDCWSEPYGFDSVWYGFNPRFLCGGPPDPDWVCNGMFMPDYPPLFPEFMADPRAINLSVGWRWNDHVFDNNIIDVSYGQPFPIWRWFNVFCDGDAMEIDLQGALWAIFAPLHESSPLVNADYYIGFPLTWAYGPWSWRLRGFHISSHIGDEYLLLRPGFERHNPSAQYLDFFLAYQLSRDIRIYSGYGRIFMTDESFPVKRNYFEWGLETYFPYLRYDAPCYCVLGQPFYAMHFRYLEDDNYRQDSTFVLGYELRKLSGMQGRLRAFLEFHKGNSLEGQFARFRTDYLSFRITYGY